MIEEATFNRCAVLRTVKFSNGLEKIETNAFRDSGLETVTTPESLRTIGHGAFAGCRNLARVVLNSDLEVLGEDDDVDQHFGVFQQSELAEITLPRELR